jgi:putative flippase GtrA
MPSEYPLIVFSPLAGLAVNVMSHILLSRLRKGVGQMLCLIVGIFVGFAFTITVSIALLPVGELMRDVAGYLFLNAVSYLALAWCYFHFVNLILASLRIRLLNEMANADGGLSEEDILMRYDAGKIIENRLERLVAGGHLVVRDGHYLLGNPAFVVIFDAFEVLKLAVLGRGNRLLAKKIGGGSKDDISALRGIGRTVRDLALLFLRYDFCRFLFVGGINTIFSYLLYASLVLIGLDYRVTITVCTVITIIWNYFTTGHFVFDNRRLGLIFKFVAVYGLIYLLNLYALMALVKHGLGPLISQAVVIPLIVVFSFTLNKLWVFRRAG